MFILKKGHQPGVYVPLRALFLVEHIWDILRCMVRYNHDVRPRLQMITAWLWHLKWAAVPQNIIRTIIGSMRHRWTACMRVDRGHTSN